MIWVAIVAAIVVLIAAFQFRSATPSTKPNLSVLPPQFVVFDLETTGLHSDRHEIIEIGAIRVNRDSDTHDTFQALIRARKRIPKRITEITGITQDLIDKDGEALADALTQFRTFVGDLPLVSFNADFDMAFLVEALRQTQPTVSIANPVSCALKMARRAWPRRKSYRLADLARDGGLSAEDSHRALSD